jgi:hypothetical protein
MSNDASSGKSVKEMMIMKNVIGALALVALGSLAITGAANASPAASLAGLSEQSAPAVEQVGYRHRGHHFHGRKYWGGWGYKRHYGHGYGHGYGYGYGFKKWCYYNPYHWKCKHYGYGY